MFHGEVHDLITVPCCQACNSLASDLDAQFRIVIASTLQTGGNPAREVLVEEAVRGAARDAALTRHMLQTATKTSVGGTAEMPGNSLQLVGMRIVRALFWHEHGERLPRTRHVTVGRIHSPEELSPRLADAMTKRSVGNGQFRYAFLRAVDRPWYSVWVLSFHGQVTLLAETESDAHRAYMLGTTALSRD